MTKKRFWADLTAEEFTGLDKQRTIAVLPLGAVEQHGPHLPLSVDRDIVEAVIGRCLALLDDDLEVLFLPTMAIGKSNEHIAFAGTLTFSAETLLRMWQEIGDCVARAGIKKLLLFNGHGGNVSAMDIVARDLRAKHGMLTAHTSWYQLSAGDVQFDMHELRHGIHAGEGETAIMLAARGHLVQMEKAANFRSKGEDWEKDLTYLGVGGGKAKFGWLIQDLNKDGACGNAAAATREKGEELLNAAARHLAAFLKEFDSLSAEGLGAYSE
ncbi:MAG: creatininase family protein [Kiloniellales bacterium]|nr:creatininase family protein [Kiloniellales bacterium]